MNKYYVYEHLSLKTNLPFYVGKGCGKRARSLCSRNDKWKTIVSEEGFKVKFLIKNIDNEFAYFIEKERIDQLKRLNILLCNSTNGGGSEYQYTQDVKDKMSKIQMGKKHTEETKQKLSNINKNKLIPNDVKEKISKTLSKKVFCEETNEYFDRVIDAAKYYGVSRYSISAVCNGTKKTLNKLHWKYI
jgi:hypothetical protein